MSDEKVPGVISRVKKRPTWPDGQRGVQKSSSCPIHSLALVCSAVEVLLPLTSSCTHLRVRNAAACAAQAMRSFDGTNHNGPRPSKPPSRETRKGDRGAQIVPTRTLDFFLSLSSSVLRCCATLPSSQHAQPPQKTWVGMTILFAVFSPATAAHSSFVAAGDASPSV